MNQITMKLNADKLIMMAYRRISQVRMYPQMR